VTSYSSSSDKSVTVDCIGSKIVVGGGADTDLPVEVGVTSLPLDSNTWQAHGAEMDPTNTSWTVTVYAICVDP
jgi:hypothetical protein